MNRCPVFIVGSPRAGTTLLAAMLGAHSHIACGPESHLLSKIKPGHIKRIIADADWPALAVQALTKLTIADEPVLAAFSLTEEEVRAALSRTKPSVAALFESTVGLYASKHGKQRWAEKTPPHMLHVQAIRAAFPDAYIIRIVRDPRDSALSMRQLPNLSDSYLANIYLWCDWYAQSDDFFNEDSQSTTVIYEQLVLNPEREMRRLCDFIEAPFEYAMLDTGRSGITVATKNEIWKKQASGPLDATRLFRWKAELAENDRFVSTVLCSKWLKDFGYACEDLKADVRCAYGLNRRKIEACLDWFYANASSAIVYRSVNDALSPAALTVFLDDSDLASSKAYTRALGLLLRRKLSGKSTFLHWAGASSRYVKKMKVLEKLAAVS